MKGDMTAEEYAEKYHMKIEHVHNFKRLYLMVEDTKRKWDNL
jgi:hypothetical protein